MVWRPIIESAARVFPRDECSACVVRDDLEPDLTAGRVAHRDARRVPKADAIERDPLREEMRRSDTRLLPDHDHPAVAIGYGPGADPAAGVRAHRQSSGGPALGDVSGPSQTLDIEILERARAIVRPDDKHPAVIVSNRRERDFLAR